MKLTVQGELNRNFLSQNTILEVIYKNHLVNSEFIFCF